MSQTVIREVTTNVWTFSRPFTRLGVIPFGGRSTAIKLNEGGVWVLASTPLEPETKAKLDELGKVQYIMGANAVHHLFLGDYKKAYPDAKLIAPSDAIQRHGDKDLKFDGVWGQDSPDTRYGFEDEIKACYFSGYKNKDVAFFHPQSRVLIEADLVFNLPATEQYSKTGSSGKIPIIGGLDSSSWLIQKSAWDLGVNKEAMKRDVNTVLSWDFDKIIPCHGDVIENNGRQAWEQTFKRYL